MDPAKLKIARRIIETSYFRGDFTLRSGAKSNFYLDKYLFETQPDILKPLGDLLSSFVTPSTIIAGAEMGGVALAAITSVISGRPFVIIRNKKKEYGNKKQFEGKLSANDSVLFLEDVATSGGQIIDAFRVIETVGAKIERVVAVIDREEGARENIESLGLQFDALFTMKDLNRLVG